MVDLSGGGMRVESRWPMRIRRGQELIVSLLSEAGELKLHVRVSWVRSAGMLAHRAGLEFTRMTPRLSAVLCYIAQSSADASRPAVGWVSTGR